MLTDEQIQYLKGLWEFSIDIGYPELRVHEAAELRKHMEPAPYAEQDKIVNYLRHAGFQYAASMSGGGLACDGQFSWSTDLADYVEANNLRLEPEFEQAVLGDSTRMTKLRKELLAQGIHTWEL